MKRRHAPGRGIAQRVAEKFSHPANAHLGAKACECEFSIVTSGATKGLEARAATPGIVVVNGWLRNRIGCQRRQEGSDMPAICCSEHRGHGGPGTKAFWRIQPMPNPGWLDPTAQAGENRPLLARDGGRIREVTIRTPKLFKQRTAVRRGHARGIVREEPWRNRLARKPGSFPLQRDMKWSCGSCQAEVEGVPPSFQVHTPGTRLLAVDAESSGGVEKAVLTGPGDQELPAELDVRIRGNRREAFAGGKVQVRCGAIERDPATARGKPGCRIKRNRGGEQRRSKQCQLVRAHF